MPTYKYFAKDSSGKSIKAKEFALSEFELKTRLTRKNLTIISISDMGGKGGIFLSGGKIKTSDLVLFCKQMSTMVKGGVPVLRAINSIASELQNPLFRSALEDVGQLVKRGESLSEGFKKFPHLFSSLFVSMVEAGEKVGSLDTLLERLGAYLLARDRLSKKIITALTYPAFIVATFLAAMAVVALWLVPKFKSIYSGFGAKLPALTQVVFSMSDLMVKNIVLIIAVTFVCVFFAHRYFFKSEKGKRVFLRMVMRIPFLGDVIKSAALSKFSRTLATLLTQGIPIAPALDLVSKSSGNVIIEDATTKIKGLILDGESIPEALRKTEVFPPLMIQMVSVGVESGGLPELLDKTADFYEDKVSDFVATLTSMIEPILIVTLGISVGTVIVALYLPIFGLSQAISGR